MRSYSGLSCRPPSSILKHMSVNYKGTIVEIPPDEYRYVTPADLKPCWTLVGGHDAHCIVCLEATYAFWQKAAPPPPGCRFGHTRKEECLEWAVPAAKQRAEDECFMKLMCADPDPSSNT
ncbi:MAG: hypothetical protein JSS38_11100 [Nitrospira sp.]|nr:hypothetical protein [Nitrospira sp.]